MQQRRQSSEFQNSFIWKYGTKSLAKRNWIFYQCELLDFLQKSSSVSLASARGACFFLPFIVRYKTERIHLTWVELAGVQGVALTRVFCLLYGKPNELARLVMADKSKRSAASVWCLSVCGKTGQILGSWARAMAARASKRSERSARAPHSVTCTECTVDSWTSTASRTRRRRLHSCHSRRLFGPEKTALKWSEATSLFVTSLLAISYGRS